MTRFPDPDTKSASYILKVMHSCLLLDEYLYMSFRYL